MVELAIDRLYRAICFLLHWVVGYGAAIIMLGVTVLAISEIVRRYYFGLVFEWGQDAVTFTMVGSLFLFFAVTQQRRSHLAMSAAMDVLHNRGYKTLVLSVRAAISALSVALYSALGWWGIPAMERSMLMERTTQSMIFEIWPFQLALIIGFGLMALVSLFQCYQDVQAARGKTVFPWAPVEEGIQI